MIDITGAITTCADKVVIESLFDNLDVEEIETTDNGNHIFEISGILSGYGYKLFTTGLVSIANKIAGGCFECAYPCFGEENDFWKIEFDAKNNEWFVYNGYRAYETSGSRLKFMAEGDE